MTLKKSFLDSFIPNLLSINQVYICNPYSLLLFPGLLDKKTRLKLLQRLSLSGTEISDVGLRYAAQFLPHLAHLAVAGCWKLSDAGLAQLAQQDSSRLIDTLESLDVARCSQVSRREITTLYW